MFKRLKTKSFVYVLALCISGALAIAGCSSNPAAVQHRVLDKSTYVTAQPSDFDGPYADDFARFVRDPAEYPSSNIDVDYRYSIVKDSKISDQEFQETQNLLTQCYQSQGLLMKYSANPFLLGSYVAVNPGGDVDGYNGKVPNKYLQPIHDSCEAKTSYSDIATLYYEMQFNPEKADLSAYSAQCLVKVGYKEPGFTAEEYRREGGYFVVKTTSSFGNETAEPGGGSTHSIQGDEPLTREQIRNITSGKTTKDIISYEDNVKCALIPRLILNGK